jgi:hypothetical protein
MGACEGRDDELCLNRRSEGTPRGPLSIVVNRFPPQPIDVRQSLERRIASQACVRVCKDQVRGTEQKAASFSSAVARTAR